MTSLLPSDDAKVGTTFLRKPGTRTVIRGTSKCQKVVKYFNLVTRVWPFASARQYNVSAGNLKKMKSCGQMFIFNIELKTKDTCVTRGT